MSDSGKSTRRDFLLRGVKAAAAIAVTGFIAQKFEDTVGPGRETSAGQPTELPDFSAAGMSGKMAIATGANRVKTVRRALDSDRRHRKIHPSRRPRRPESQRRLCHASNAVGDDTPGPCRRDRSPLPRGRRSRRDRHGQFDQRSRELFRAERNRAGRAHGRRRGGPAGC